jgi:Tfp pilus assembly protein PilZ
MDSTFIELRVADAAALQAWWLDGLPHGGIFVPGDFELFAGAPVLLCVVIEGQPVGSTLVAGTVIQRRTSLGASAPPPAMRRENLLRPGLGIAFDEGTEARVAYLVERSRALAKESRSGLRWPLGIPAHVVLRDGGRPVRISLEDVGTRGARISLPPGISPERQASATLAIRSNELEVTSAFLGAVAWVSPHAVGLTLALETKEDRARWARLVTRAREGFDRRRAATVRLP